MKKKGITSLIIGGTAVGITTISGGVAGAIVNSENQKSETDNGNISGNENNNNNDTTSYVATLSTNEYNYSDLVKITPVTNDKKDIQIALRNYLEVKQIEILNYIKMYNGNSNIDVKLLFDTLNYDATNTYFNASVTPITVNGNKYKWDDNTTTEKIITIKVTNISIASRIAMAPASDFYNNYIELNEDNDAALNRKLASLDLSKTFVDHSSNKDFYKNVSIEYVQNTANINSKTFKIKVTPNNGYTWDDSSKNPKTVDISLTNLKVKIPWIDITNGMKVESAEVHGVTSLQYNKIVIVNDLSASTIINKIDSLKNDITSLVSKYYESRVKNVDIVYDKNKIIPTSYGYAVEYQFQPKEGFTWSDSQNKNDLVFRVLVPNIYTSSNAFLASNNQPGISVSNIKYNEFYNNNDFAKILNGDVVNKGLLYSKYILLKNNNVSELNSYLNTNKNTITKDINEYLISKKIVSNNVKVNFSNSVNATKVQGGYEINLMLTPTTSIWETSKTKGAVVFKVFFNKVVTQINSGSAVVAPIAINNIDKSKIIGENGFYFNEAFKKFYYGRYVLCENGVNLNNVKAQFDQYNLWGEINQYVANFFSSQKMQQYVDVIANKDMVYANGQFWLTYYVVPKNGHIWADGTTSRKEFKIQIKNVVSSFPPSFIPEPPFGMI